MTATSYTGVVRLGRLCQIGPYLVRVEESGEVGGGQFLVEITLATDTPRPKPLDIERRKWQNVENS